MDLADPQVAAVVEDQVDQELFDDPAVAALEETQDLNGSHDVDGRDELAGFLLLGRHDDRPPRGPGGGGGAALGSRSTSVRFPLDSVATSAVAGVRWRTRCTTYAGGGGRGSRRPTRWGDRGRCPARARRARCGGGSRGGQGGTDPWRFLLGRERARDGREAERGGGRRREIDEGRVPGPGETGGPARQPPLSGR